MKLRMFDLSGKLVLVTGATGFIGGRLIERLVLESGANVRAVVHDFRHASRVARFAIEMVPGDVTERSDVDRAVSGCEIVFHCAYGNQGSEELQRLVNVEGTKNVLEAALRAKVKRVVHLSTLMVYGITPDGDCDETQPRRYLGNIYADSKLDAEKIAISYAQNYGLPVAVLQPTAVYGPWAPVWTVSVLNSLKAGRVILVNGGDGLCNAVYIDDLVSAMVLAAVKEESVGEAFLISGEQPVTWRHFYGRYERMLGVSGTVSMSAREAEAYYSKQQKYGGIIREMLNIIREEPIIRQRILRTREVASLRRAARALLSESTRHSLKRRISGNNPPVQPNIPRGGGKRIHPLNPLMIEFFSTKSRVLIDKAKRILDYQPAFDFESGMWLTEQWARWANLLDQ